MVQLDDLSDDCLLEVLDRVSLNELFKMQRLNQRMKQLTGIKMGVKIKAIAIKEPKRRLTTSSCSHFNSISPDQVLVFESRIKNKFNIDSYVPIQFILSLLSKCSSVKAIDFGHRVLNCEVFLETFQRCPELECVKLLQFFVKQDEWDRALDEISQRIVHLEIEWHTDKPTHLPSHRFLETVAAKCRNIQRIVWVTRGKPTRDLMIKFKLLPKSCWISLACSEFAYQRDGAFEDNFDELNCYKFSWSQFSHRYDRLSILTLHHVRGPVREVVFAGLKRLDFKEESCYFNSQLINRLLVSQFPLLQMFGYNASLGYTEDNYKAMFQRISTVKMLKIRCGTEWFKYPKLPQLAAVSRLKNLETIQLKILDVKNEWEPNGFLQQIENCVDDISSLNKLTVDIRKCTNNVWYAAAEDLVKRLKLKQNRVAIIFVLKSSCSNDV